MKLSYKKSDLCATGMAIFAMFFGAGNIIFPLALGQQLFEQTPYAIIGLLITAVVFPFCGLLAMFLFQGQIRPFFDRLGRWPGSVLAILIISLLGPLGSTPRCITLAFSTMNLVFPGINSILFNAIACGCLFILVYKKQRLLDFLGYLLTPILLGLLIFIVIKGLFLSPSMVENHPLAMEAYANFWKGLKEGYNTMDLLAAFFFAPVIISLSQTRIACLSDIKNQFNFVLKASAIGAVLLGLIYISFTMLASLYAETLNGVPKEELLAALALKMLGPYGGLFVCSIIILACLTTAIALIAAFVNFIQQELLKGKGDYGWILAISLFLTFFVACFEFQGISLFLTPILEICYPLLILLTAFNLIERLYYLTHLTQ